MNVYGVVDVYIRVFLTSALVGGSQLNAPAALSQGKEPPVPIEYEAEWAPNRSGRLEIY
jgi:hypothetical protein